MTQAVARRADEDMIGRSIALWVEPGSTVELRCPKSRRGVVSGYYTDIERLREDAIRWSGQAEAVYLTLNPVLADLRARANNRCREYCRTHKVGKKEVGDPTTTDAEIVRRRWLLVDLDPVRPAGISSTDTEREAALRRALEVRAWLTTSANWPAPILADSGNGAHLLYRLDLPNTPEVTSVLQKCLEALAARFDDGAVTVDTSTFNASRICKVYGTLSAKGDSVPELGRVHRLATILEAPAVLEVVTL